MKKKILPVFALFFAVVLATSAFAQPTAPGEQETRPGPGYGAGPNEGYGYGPGYGYGMGPGWCWGGGYGMRPWMMGPGWGGYGMGPGMMGWGYGPGYGWGRGMMGRGYGYGRGQGQSYRNLSPEEREARAKAFIDEYLRRNLPGYTLEKKPAAKKK